jgi:hypothetical protein
MEAILTRTSLNAALAAVLALSGGATAMAQPYSYDPDAEARYQQQQQDYDNAQADYADRQAAYDQNRDDYAARLAAYHRQRHDYEQARADYDARYGEGAYQRQYGDADSRYPAPAAGDYQADTAYTDTRPYGDAACAQRRDDRTVGGGLIGALAGAAIGSNIAGRGVRTEGAVLGAVAGGVVGGSIGRSTAHCDTVGYYYRYDQTYAYREGQWDREASSGEHDYGWYSSRGCRLAVAPARYGEDTDDRYVRVCPDDEGRYRFTP